MILQRGREWEDSCGLAGLSQVGRAAQRRLVEYAPMWPWPKRAAEPPTLASGEWRDVNSEWRILSRALLGHWFTLGYFSVSELRIGW